MSSLTGHVVFFAESSSSPSEFCEKARGNCGEEIFPLRASCANPTHDRAPSNACLRESACRQRKGRNLLRSARQDFVGEAIFLTNLMACCSSLALLPPLLARSLPRTNFTALTASQRRGRSSSSRFSPSKRARLARRASTGRGKNGRQALASLGWRGVVVRFLAHSSLSLRGDERSRSRWTRWRRMCARRRRRKGRRKRRAHYSQEGGAPEGRRRVVARIPFRAILLLT